MNYRNTTRNTPHFSQKQAPSLKNFGIDEISLGLSDVNNYNIKEQISSCDKTLDLLYQVGLRDDELGEFSFLTKSVLLEYLGDTRSTEQIRPGVAAPTFLHLMRAIQVACSIYLFIKYPEKYPDSGLTHQLYKEHIIRIQKFIGEFESSKLAIVLAILFHDSPEDGKFLFSKNDLPAEERIKLEDEILEGPKKNFQIHDHIQFNECIKACDFQDILDKARATQGNEEQITQKNFTTLLYEKLKHFTEETGIFSALQEYTKILSTDNSFTLNKYLKRRFKKGRGSPHEKNMFERQLFLDLSNYHILYRLISNNISIDTALKVLKLVDNVTFRKIGGVKLVNKEKMLQAVHEDIATAWVKSGDVFHNISSVSNLAKFKRKKLLEQGKMVHEKTIRRDELIKKYSDYMETIDAVGPFLFAIYPAIVNSLDLPLDPVVKEKIKEFQSRKNYLQQSRRGQQPLLVHVDVISKDTRRQRVAKYAMLQVGYTARDDKDSQKFQVKLQELKDDQKMLQEDTYLDDMFTILDVFSGDPLFNEEKKIIPFEFVYEIIRRFVGDEHITPSLSDYGFDISPTGFQKINRVLDQALKFYRDDLYGDIHDTYFKNTWFEVESASGKQQHRFALFSTKKLVEFLRSATQKGSSWNKKTTCSLLKLAYQNILFENSDIIKQQDRNFAHAIASKLLPLLRVDEMRKAEYAQFNKQLNKGRYADDEVGYRQYFQNIEAKLVDGSVSTHDQDEKILALDREHGSEMISKLTFPITIQNVYLRSKSGESVRYKQLSDPQYGKLELIRDYSGIRMEVKTKEEALMLLQHMYYFFFEEKRVLTIKTKGLVFKQDLTDYKHILTDHFATILGIYLRTSEATPREGKSNSAFKDISICGIAGSKYASMTEIQIVLSNNTNENNFSHHGVFTGAKIIESMVRLEGYVNTEYIKHVATMQIYKHPELKGLGIPPGFHPAVERLVNHYIHTILIEMKHTEKKSSQVRFYTTPDRRNHLRRNGFLQGVHVRYKSGGTFKWTTDLLPGWERKEYIKVAHKLIQNIELMLVQNLNTIGTQVNTRKTHLKHEISKKITEVNEILSALEQKNTPPDERWWKEKKYQADEILASILKVLTDSRKKVFRGTDV